MEMLTEEEYEATKDMYLIRSGRFMYNYCLAMPFVVIICVFFLCLVNYVKGEIKTKKKAEKELQKIKKKRMK